MPPPAPLPHRATLLALGGCALVAVPPDATYSRERGFEFEPGAKLFALDRGGAALLRRDFISGDAPFHFAARGPLQSVRFVVNTRTPQIVAVGDIKAGDVGNK